MSFVFIDRALSTIDQRRRVILDKVWLGAALRWVQRLSLSLPPRSLSATPSTVDVLNVAQPIYHVLFSFVSNKIVIIITSRNAGDAGGDSLCGRRSR